MIRVAFTLIGGKNWTGGHNYLLNLLRALATYQGEVVTPVLFVPLEGDVGAEAFTALPGVEVVRSELLNSDCRKQQLVQAILLGRVSPIAKLFKTHRIDVVFEAAQFFGWRLGLPAIAWIPDFQHKVLPHLFSKSAWWKREIGFRAQIFGNRIIMLSSDDAKHACERYYPATRGRTHTVHFAVPPGAAPDFPAARAIADSYGLPQNFFFMPNQFWRHKNHIRVLDAMAILRARGVDIVVAASGTQHDPRAPEYFAAFEQTLKEQRLDTSFRLLGLIPYAHLSALMRCCQSLLNPSLFEGWSTTVEEARAMATPMLLSDLDVHREQMGTAALYFRRNSGEDLANALQAVQPFDGIARELALTTARSQAEARVRGFAENFARLASTTAESGSA
ncbi:MAG TPA: glycosyltransferase family 1 protein [Rhodocyclaceae bacterium]|nr:glycosyltransferase family 1 protein [Rhodocyclaceae bacterium]